MPHKKVFDQNLGSFESSIDELVEKLNAWAEAYYREDRPLVPDADYDAELKRLIELESQFPALRRPNSPTFRIGSAPRVGVEKHQHLVPMLSLANVFSLDEVQKFFDRTQKALGSRQKTAEFLIEEKIDGLAVSLTFERGLFTRGTTRGDGRVGEVVTENLKTLKDIPLKLRTSSKVLPELLEVRGEVFMDLSGFERLNADLLASEEKPFANPRNAAAGSLRVMDSRITARRPLQFFAYQIIGLELDQDQVLKTLKDWGFRVNSSFVRVTKLEEVEESVKKYEKIRQSRTLSYDIDGLVIKVNSRELANAMGSIAQSPRWAVAYKLSAIEKLTQVLAIEVQVGRTGAMTPVAHLKPVEVGGVQVARATLHNEEQLRLKDVRVGDTVWVRRAGDVIPEIVQVDIGQRPAGALAFLMPEECPSCQEKLVRQKSFLLCLNRNCAAKILDRIAHFASRTAMDIRGLGTKLIEEFFHLGWLRTLSDIYTLKNHVEDMKELEGYGEKSVLKLMDAIEASKLQTPARFLFGLGIDLVGRSTAEELVENTRGLDHLFSLSEAELLELPNVGPETARIFVEAVADPEFRAEIVRLRSLGLEGIFHEKKAMSSMASSDSQTLKDQSFVITGSLSKPREHYRSLLKSLGATVSESVSKKTSYVVAGEDAGSKLEKAIKLGVPVLNESGLQLLLQDLGKKPLLSE